MLKHGLLTQLSLALTALLFSGAAGAGTWQPVGIGDCPGRDVSGSRSPAPEAGKCDASFAGMTAVCWTHGCTYKNVPTGSCTGGANPGQMYTCAGAPTAKPVAQPAAASGSWQYTGTGDCPGRDVSGSAGSRPEASKCNASFAGNTAVCWATGCTYKNVATAACTGGANPGQMYTCAAAAPPPPAPAGPVWQYTGNGDCPGRDVSGSAGSRPEASKCTASFAGNTAVCWSTGCTYKTVMTGQCIGGANPGQMYTCANPETAAPAPAPAPVPAPAPAPLPSAGTWQPVGVGDCSGRDVAGSRSPYPEPGKCDPTFAGNTAVCWATGCTYKNVPTAQCTGGANPGQMYTCTSAAGAPAPPPPAAPAAPTKPRGKRYSVINFTGDKQNTHEFMVDWKACKVSELNQESDTGSEDITIDVCRPGSRLVIKADFRTTGYWIRYDWVVLDDGAAIAGSYRDPTTCGPSVGKRGK